MTRGRARTHLDASTPGHIRQAFCGWLDVDCETDISKVTCKACLSRLAGKRAAQTNGRKARSSGPDVSHALAEAFRATLAPTAGATPRITAVLWIASCKGGEHRRCGECELCVWEREARLWASVAPWNTAHRAERSASAPRWPSLAAALCALAEWERHDRSAPSALNGILERIRRGDAGDTQSARADDPLLRRAGELVRVRQALDVAYPEDGHPLPAARRKALLLLRTPGVLAEKMPTYEKLSEVLGASVGELRALVRRGRLRMLEELVPRGLVPPERVLRAPVGSSSVRRFEEEEEEPPWIGIA